MYNGINKKLGIRNSKRFSRDFIFVFSACLPFKVLTPKSDGNVGNPPSQKKRKLPVDATGPVKASKNQRSSEKNKNKEPEDVENRESEKPAAKKGGPLEKFVQTKKEEKSTGQSIFVDLTETEEQATDSKETGGETTEAVSQENAQEMEVTEKKEEMSEVAEEKEDLKTEDKGKNKIGSTEEDGEEKAEEKLVVAEKKIENAPAAADKKKEMTKIEKEEDKSKESANTLAPEAAQEELKSPASVKPKAAKVMV